VKGSKKRLDMLVLAAGLAESREQARRLILAGQIRIAGHPATKAGNLYPVDSVLERVAGARFVSRGGEKLEAAFESFGLEVTGLDCLDVGSSTGGFTDCLLQHGAGRVVALDVGRAQLHQKLREDPRVTVMEGFNARHLTAEDLPFVPQVAVTDVAFISLTLILPPMVEVLAAGGTLVGLIKPQFEAGREQVKRGGVVRDPAVHEEVVERVTGFAREELGLKLTRVVKSPLLGPKGNTEFLACWKKP